MKKALSNKSIAEKEKDLLTETIVVSIILFIGSVYFSLCCLAYGADHPLSQGLDSVTGGIEYITEPIKLIPIRYNIGSGIGIAFFITLVYILLYFNKRLRLHNDINTLKGSSEWANHNDILEKFAEGGKRGYKNDINNIPFAKETYVSINTTKHYRALNTMVVGATGSGKTRFVLKPNLLQMNSSYVITDPKGEILGSCGEMLRRNGYRVRVFDILNMGNCDTYNPLKYCKKESDVRKLADTFVLNSSDSNQKSDDPFWDKAMTAFLCAIIALLTQKPKGSDVPYGMIPEVMGGQCYTATFSTICELTRLANKKWTKTCGIKIMDGVELGDGKNNTANASQLAAIFENVRHYEAKLQNKPVELIEKPYCLLSWENLKIAPEKTLTTVFMMAGSYLDVFNIEQVRDLTSSDTINLDEFGKGRDALFLIIPPTDKTYNFLIAFLYTQLTDLLYNIGANESVGSKILKLKNGEIVKFFSKEDVLNGISEDVDDIRNAKVVKHENFIYQKEGTFYDVYKQSEKKKRERVYSSPSYEDSVAFISNHSNEEGKLSMVKRNVKEEKIDDSYYDIISAKGDYISSRQTIEDANKYLSDLKEAELHSGKAPQLPYHVRMLQDEFANIGKMPGFKEILGTCRGYEISYVIILQSITQLKGMYTDDYEVIDANCPFTIFLGGDENSNNEYLSKKIGTSTVKGANLSLDSKNKGSSSYNVEERSLMKPEEIGRMPFKDCLVLIYGEQPIYDAKIDYTTQSNYKQTNDYMCEQGKPQACKFNRPDNLKTTIPIIYKPIEPKPTPNVFDFDEEAFMRIFKGEDLAKAEANMRRAIKSSGKQSFDFNSSISESQAGVF